MITDQPRGSVTNPIGSALINLTQIYVYGFSGNKLLEYIKYTYDLTMASFQSPNPNLQMLYKTADYNIFNKEFTLYYSILNKIVIGITDDRNMLFIYPMNILYYDHVNKKSFIGNITNINNISSKIILDEIYAIDSDKLYYFGWTEPFDSDLISQYNIHEDKVWSSLFTCNYTLKSTELFGVLQTVTQLYNAILTKPEVKKKINKSSHLYNDYYLLYFKENFTAGYLICPPHIQLIIKCENGDNCDVFTVLGFYNLYTNIVILLEYEDPSGSEYDIVKVYHNDGGNIRQIEQASFVVQLSYVTLLFGGFIPDYSFNPINNSESKKRKIEDNDRNTILQFVNSCKNEKDQMRLLRKRASEKRKALEDLERKYTALEKKNKELMKEIQTIQDDNAAQMQIVLNEKQSIDEELSGIKGLAELWTQERKHLLVDNEEKTKLLVALNTECSTYYNYLEEILQLIKAN